MTAKELIKRIREVKTVEEARLLREEEQEWLKTASDIDIALIRDSGAGEMLFMLCGLCLNDPPKMVYHSTVDGKDYTLSNLVGLPPKTEAGSEVTVRYNPQNPQDAGYDFGEAAKEKYMLYVGIGVLVLGILIMIIF